jgi:hypothetical protein
MPDSPSDDSPKKRRPGGQPGNENARGKLRHGLRAGKLPPRLQYIEHRINDFRRQLEDAVSERKGEVSIIDAAGINSACKWERHGLLAQHWLRKEADNLSAGDRLKFSEAIAKASDARDKNIRSLGLDAPAADPWTIIAVTPSED